MKVKTFLGKEEVEWLTPWYLPTATPKVKKRSSKKGESYRSMEQRRLGVLQPFSKISLLPHDYVMT